MAQSPAQVAEARRVAAEHLDEREPVVREPHRLRALEMGVARQHRVEVLAGAREQHRAQLVEAARAPRTATSRTYRARSVATWSLRLRPVWSRPAGSPIALDRRASTFMWMSSSAGSNGKRPSSISRPIAVEAVEQGALVRLRHQAGAAQHLGVGARLAQVVTRQRPVEVDRRGEALDRGIGVLAEAAAPRLRPRSATTLARRPARHPDKLSVRREFAPDPRVSYRDGRTEGTGGRRWRDANARPGATAPAARGVRRAGRGRAVRRRGCARWRSWCWPRRSPPASRRPARWSRPTGSCGRASRALASGCRPASTARRPSCTQGSTGSRSTCAGASRGSAIARRPPRWSCPPGQYVWSSHRVRLHLRAFEHPSRPEPARDVVLLLRGRLIDQIRAMPSGGDDGRGDARARAARRLLRTRRASSASWCASRRCRATWWTPCWPSRISASRRTRASTCAGSRARCWANLRAGLDPAGRQHAHAAARQELLPDARADVPPQAARGRDGPDRGGPLREGRDPRGLPERDLPRPAGLDRGPRLR